jgi:hypothetical protein
MMTKETFNVNDLAAIRSSTQEGDNF